LESASEQLTEPEPLDTSDPAVNLSY
jgi:hypothetical protein